MAGLLSRKHLLRLPLCACALVMTMGAAAAPGRHQVDLALVIAADVSYSVNEEEARFQREGAIAAFRSPEVVKAIQSGSLGRIAVAYLDFSSYGTNRLIANWMIVHDKASADAFADALTMRRRTLGVQTSISSGLEMALSLLEAGNFEAEKRVIDVSGDGPNNEGPLVTTARDAILAKGITINGLPIVTEADKLDVYYLPDLDKYYAGCVIGGPGAFIHVAHGFEDLARALRRKLVLEISDASKASDPLLVPVGANSLLRPGSGFVYERGCDIGERMRYGGGRPR